ncbi:MAG: hypothetical protein H0T46_05375 [Deltaproteobacteria bacterium]|nr:hypothetical protein [Deltaproteobacteria bacterium]
MAVDRKLGKEIQRRLKRFGGRRLEQRLDWLEPYPVGLRIGATVDIQKSAWSELAARSKRLRREANRDLAGMKAQQVEWNALWTDAQRLRAGAASWQTPGERSDWPAIRKDLLRELPNRGISGAALKAALREFARVSSTGMMKVVADPIVWLGRQLDAGAPGRLSGLAAADLADAVSTFNLSVENGSVAPRRPAPSVASVALGRTSALLRGMHTSLRTGTRARLAVKASQAEAKAQALLGPLARVAAYYADATLALETALDALCRCIRRYSQSLRDL